MAAWLRCLLGLPPTEQHGRGDVMGAEAPSRPEPPPPPPTPLPRPDPEPEPAEPERPPAATSPGRTIHVHADRLEERPGPLRLTPSEALMLANDGPQALRRDREER